MGDTYEIWKYATETVQSAVHACFQLFWTGSYIPRAVNTSHLSLMYKLKGERTKVKSYRPISLMSCLVKIYEKVLETRISQVAKNKEIISRLQHACKPGKGAIDAADLVAQLLGKEKYILCSLDLSKAYDIGYLYRNCSTSWAVLG